jgi:hypothetical protein
MELADEEIDSEEGCDEEKEELPEDIVEKIKETRVAEDQMDNSKVKGKKTEAWGPVPVERTRRNYNTGGQCCRKQ